MSKFSLSKAVKALIAVVVALASLIIVTTLPTMAGFKAMVVTSGSMEPAIRVGSIILIQEAEHIQKGDVITFALPGNRHTLVTHRVVDIGNQGFQVQGDAVAVPDVEVVKKEHILGKLLFTIPLIGYFVMFAKTQLGLILLILIPSAIMVYQEIQNIKKFIISASLLVILLGAPFSGETKALFSDTAASTGSFSAGIWALPAVSLFSPNGGETLYHQNSHIITWDTSSTDPAASVTVDLHYSTDSGATFPNVIATGETNDSSFTWTIPSSVISSSVRVRVTATDSHGLANTDASDADLTIKSPIVINEFVPNPVGTSTDGNPMPDGEWVELYDNGSVDVDVAGWVLYDSDDTHELVISTSNSDNNNNTADAGETIVPANSRLVVYRNSDGDFILNNTGGDSVRLYDNAIESAGRLIDSYTYTVNAADGKSFARIPDGTGEFVDPIPTPLQPNKMEEDQLASQSAELRPDQNSEEDTP